jgi:uncharacterized HAD superfamily protein
MNLYMYHDWYEKKHAVLIKNDNLLSQNVNKELFLFAEEMWYFDL